MSSKRFSLLRAILTCAISLAIQARPLRTPSTMLPTGFRVRTIPHAVSMSPSARYGGQRLWRGRQ
jgi:hypothetical protein